MQVLNSNAKQPYMYNRFEWAEMTREELQNCLYERAVYNSKNRHRRVETIGNKNGRGITYYNITCGFDCETYTDTVAERSYMYIWQMSINNNVVRGRTYEECIELFDTIKEIMQPKDNHRLLVFIHNMSYEFSFFRGWWDLSDASQNFLKDERTPLKLTHNSFIEFRDSMALCGGDSLKGLAKNYCNTQKCVGDLDYSIPRNRYTELTEEENGYVDNDVLILSEFSEYVFTHIMNKYTKLPLTQTGLLTNECKYMLNETYKYTDAFHRYNVECMPSNHEQYIVESNYLYRGGYTHSNINYIEEDLYDLMGVDITSSYPYCMVQKIYPKMWEKVGKVTTERVNQDIQNGLVSIFIASFRHIKTKGLHCIESKSKCLELSPYASIDNGRVYEAHEYNYEEGNTQPGMVVYLTSFDWQNYQHYYEFDEKDVKITAYQFSETRYMYKHIVKPMLKYYLQKATLKAQGEPYAIPKARVNSFYGLNVKRLNAEATKYDNNGFSTDEAKPYEEQIKASITNFYHGCLISAYARYRLLTLCWEVYEKFGIKGIYADTDSWKFLHPTDELIEWLEERNKKIREDNKKNIEYFTEYDEAYADLGEWDIEFYPWRMYDPNSKKAYIKRWKCLGAKRYIIEVDEWNKQKQKREVTLHQTVAGLPKGEMLKQYGTIDKCFTEFSDHMIISGCKLYSKYVDVPYTITVTDNQGHTDTHLELSCNALLPSNFSLTIDKIWKSFYIGLAETNKNDYREQRII